jgi:hypothetical protein
MGQWSAVHGEDMGRHNTHGYGDTVRTKQVNGERAVTLASGEVLLTYSSAVDPAFNIVTCTAVKTSNTLHGKRHKKVYSHSKIGT